MTTIYITPRSVYGTDKYYPACPAAQLFADIAGTKTLTPDVLVLIDAAGHEIWVESPGGLAHRMRSGEASRL